MITQSLEVTPYQAAAAFFGSIDHVVKKMDQPTRVSFLSDPVSKNLLWINPTRSREMKGIIFSEDGQIAGITDPQEAKKVLLDVLRIYDCTEDEQAANIWGNVDSPFGRHATFTSGLEGVLFERTTFLSSYPIFPTPKERPISTHWRVLEAPPPLLTIKGRIIFR